MDTFVVLNTFYYSILQLIKTTVFLHFTEVTGDNENNAPGWSQVTNRSLDIWSFN